MNLEPVKQEIVGPNVHNVGYATIADFAKLIREIKLKELKKQRTRRN